LHALGILTLKRCVSSVRRFLHDSTFGIGLLGETRFEGERLAFGLFDVPGGYDEPECASARETFIYMIGGRMHARVGGEAKTVRAGDVIEIPKGMRYRLKPAAPCVRYALVCSTPYLEQRIDGMTAEEREQARINNKAN